MLSKWLAKQTPRRVMPPPVPHGKVRILFVCMGNICRSPTAVGVMRKFLQKAGLQHLVAVDSAGTHDYCIGEPPDPQAQAAASRRGYDLAALRARQLVPTDFESFDLLLAMDRNNLALLQCMCPHQHRAKIRLLMTYALESPLPVIPDPYGRDHEDFETALDYIEDACNGLVSALAHRNSIPR